VRKHLTVLGGGLAGCEAAWQAVERGLNVVLLEMCSYKSTDMHRTGDLAEMVCSNSLCSLLPDRAGSVLKREFERLGSLLMACAWKIAVPAAAVLVVDRERFTRAVMYQTESHPKLVVRAEETEDIPASPMIMATGPFTFPALSDVIGRLTGSDHLYFYDTIARVITVGPIDRQVVFSMSRRVRPAQVHRRASVE